MPLSFTSIALIKEFDPNDTASDFRPYDLAAADFNQDNKLDITSDRHVFLGDGTGKFQEVAQSEIVRAALSAVAQRVPTDLNQDGKTDLVALTPAGVTVLLGDGSGSFSSTQAFTAGTKPVALTIADLNQDNIPDVITTNSGRSKDRSTQNLSILLGKNDGTLKPPKSIAVHGRPLNSVVGDFNGDGKRDIAVLNKRGQTQLTVLLGNGKGNFQLARSIKLEEFRGDRIVAADFNGDGKTDVAATTDEKVSILLGARQETLKLHNQFLSVSPSKSNGNLIVGDINGDGKVDLIMTSADSGNTTVHVLLGNGKGDFSRAAGPFLASVNDDRSDMTNAYDIVQGDFNGDGKLDLSTADGFSFYSGSPITVFINTTVGQDAVAISSSIDGSSASSGSIDVDLNERKLAYNGSQAFQTTLNQNTTDVIGTIRNDKIRGSKHNNFLNGYGGDDVIAGSDGKDQLIGGAGKDQLTGDSGRDKFIFSNTPNYPEGLNQAFERSRMGIDQVVDFQPGEDKIILDGGTFTALKQKIQFASVNHELAAQTSSAILTYVRTTGRLYYNANGSQSGFGSGGLFAEFNNQANLSIKDFSVFL